MLTAGGNNLLTMWSIFSNRKDFQPTRQSLSKLRNESDLRRENIQEEFLSVYIAELKRILESLSTRVFETRTATGSELFSLLTWPHTTTFTLLSIFSPLEMSSITIWETIWS